MADNLEDTCLDNPAARDKFPAIVAAARRDGWLDSGFQARGSGYICALVVMALSSASNQAGR